ncbi:RNA methylase family protein [Didymella exigua CBS 183.55]|uniref:tRNA (guanine(10)-N(2))-methyltransferase n=1 Tax=Didymella exigua CBS 183.55 TaxID=1150837 RepID=A0A6A5RUK0_9PLEO|nr:RNA methylase family protein [Didymella exigua CBS 183.55]KAF1930668.1 RNA methylase family protein [Didymella exigua CBS 183.55]
MPTYLVRLAQAHESFRTAELRALAELAGVELQMERYEDDSPYCIVTLPSDAAARTLAARAVLVQAIYALWGQGDTYDALRSDVRQSSSAEWAAYEHASFSFRIERYRGVQAAPEHIRAIIESFSFLGFKGRVQIKDAEARFRIFEEYALDARVPARLYLGRWIADSGRSARHAYDLKKRHYISTTSMDAELALVTANIALAAGGKLFYDPFMGAAGFPLACAHFGAVVTGSDIDGRSIRGLGGSARRGQTGPKNVAMNFDQYGTAAQYLGGFVADLTNSPLRVASQTPWLDGIVCDPPYGIREGLKVLGPRTPLLASQLSTHAAQSQAEGYVPPKRPYSFTALQHDILAFAAATLVPGGRLSMWVPTANDEDVELVIPSHPCLELHSVCTQPFNKWSRRLLTYRRRAAGEVDADALGREEREPGQEKAHETGTRASDLNDFRRKYFEGFREFEDMKKEFIRMKAADAAAAVAQDEVVESTSQQA